jgi:hypothetical protein
MQMQQLSESYALAAGFLSTCSSSIDFFAEGGGDFKLEASGFLRLPDRLLGVERVVRRRFGEEDNDFKPE